MCHVNFLFDNLFALFLLFLICKGIMRQSEKNI